MLGTPGWWSSGAPGAQEMLRRCWVMPGDAQRTLGVLRDAGLCWDRLPAPPAGTHPTAAPNP